MCVLGDTIGKKESFKKKIEFIFCGCFTNVLD